MANRKEENIFGRDTHKLLVNIFPEEFRKGLIVQKVLFFKKSVTLIYGIAAIANELKILMTEEHSNNKFIAKNNLKGIPVFP